MEGKCQVKSRPLPKKEMYLGLAGRERAQKPFLEPQVII